MTISESPSPVRTRRSFVLPNWIGVWELSLLFLVAIALVLGSVVSPFFLTADNFAITAARARQSDVRHVIIAKRRERRAFALNDRPQP